MKQIKVLTLLAMLLIALFTGCTEDEMSESALVESVYPLKTTMVSELGLKISVTFSTAMDAATITASTFKVAQQGNPMSGIVQYSGMTATFTPMHKFAHNIDILATITTGAKNIHGQSLPHDYNWDFTVCIAPTIVSASPTDGSVCVPLGQPISAVFSESTNPASVTTSTFLLTTGTTSVDGVVTFSDGTAYFTPTNSLLAATLYTVTLTTGVLSGMGTPMENPYVWSFTTAGPLCDQTAECPQNVDLKTAGNFGILAGTAISNVGLSVINDLDVGISPGFRSSITGFPPAIILNGDIYAADDIAPPGSISTQAQLDLTEAYLVAESATSPTPVTITGDLGGRTLVPGIYTSESSMLLQSGDLILDGSQSPCGTESVWIFQVGSALTTVGGGGGNVIIIGGASADRVIWQVGSSATIGDGTSFKGNILALTSITLGSGSTIEGRALARNGAVTLAGANTINKP